MRERGQAAGGARSKVLSPKKKEKKNKGMYRISFCRNSKIGKRNEKKVTLIYAFLFEFYLLKREKKRNFFLGFFCHFYSNM